MGVNKAIIIGNLGVDPEVRYTSNNQAVANLRVATNEVWNDREGRRQERTEWHRIVAFGRLAEQARDYLSKGRQVYVEGRIQTREWQDKDGNRRFTTEIVAQTIQFLGGGEGRGRGGYEEPPPPDGPEDYGYGGGGGGGGYGGGSGSGGGSGGGGGGYGGSGSGGYGGGTAQQPSAPQGGGGPRGGGQPAPSDPAVVEDDDIPF